MAVLAESSRLGEQPLCRWKAFVLNDFWRVIWRWINPALLLPLADASANP
jgi:hypothetical protein